MKKLILLALTAAALALNKFLSFCLQYTSLPAFIGNLRATAIRAAFPQRVFRAAIFLKPPKREEFRSSPFLFALSNLPCRRKTQWPKKFLFVNSAKSVFILNYTQAHGASPSSWSGNALRSCLTPRRFCNPGGIKHIWRKQLCKGENSQKKL